MTDDNKAHFKELVLVEKKSKLSFVANQKIEITIWKKASSDKFKVVADIFLLEDLKLVLGPKTELNKSLKDVLYNFSINGVSFFGKGKIETIDNKISLNCENQLFKSERRQNYRLLTYPHHKAYAELDFEKSEVIESNVVSINTKKSTTGLFKNFLELVDDNGDKDMKQPSLSFRVFDLSVTGVALLFDKIENDILKEKNIISNLTIKLDTHKFLVGKAEVKYISKLDGNRGYSYKAGIHFLEMDTNLDSEIGFIINKFLRDTDKEFEDFLV